MLRVALLCSFCQPSVPSDGRAGAAAEELVLCAAAFQGFRRGAAPQGTVPEELITNNVTAMTERYSNISTVLAHHFTLPFINTAH